MIRFFIQIALVCALYAAPYVAFQMRINEAFLGAAEAGAWNFVRFAKFVVYGLTAPAFVFVVWFFYGEKRQVVCGVISAVYAVVLLSITNYYDYFGVVPHWNQLGNLDKAGVIGGHIQSQLLGWSDFFFVVSIVAGFLIMVGFVKAPTKGWSRLIPVMIGGPALLLLGVQLVRYPIFDRLNAYGYTLGCSHYGIGPTYAVMLGDFLPRKTRSVPFPFEKSEVESSQFSGELRGANLLIVQVESLDATLIGRRVGREPVMPFLEKLASENVYFSDCVAMHAGGGSSDAELAALLSLIPLTTGSGFATANWSRIEPLSKILKAAGYTCVGLHSNRGSFYERSRRYAAMGFADFHDQKRFTGDAAGWYSKDAAFFEQSVDKLKLIPQPFFGYAITLQSHGPFRNYRAESNLEFEKVLPRDSDSERDYLLSFREVDQALARLFTHLEDARLIDSTLVVIYGDHESGMAKNGAKPGERVPLLFCHPRLGASVNRGLVSQIDVAPTVADLLGAKPSPNWLGRNLFAYPDSDRQIVLPGGKAITNEETAEFNDAALRVVDYSKAMLGR